MIIILYSVLWKILSEQACMYCEDRVFHFSVGVLYIHEFASLFQKFIFNLWK
jgi:hypothetical protein